MQLRAYIILLSFILIGSASHAQMLRSYNVSKDDYLYQTQDRSYIAKRTAMRSALIPGWGQYINKQKIKIPFIYLALGTSTYFIIDNYNKYKTARQAYLYRLDNNPETEIDRYRFASTDYIQNEKQLYRKYIDYSVLVTVLFYTLNILDAAIFSHLQDFDVSENLSMHPTLTLQPNYQSLSTPSPQIGIVLHTK